MCLFIIISRFTRIYMDMCLENPRDRGAWWAAVYGVAQSWTRLMQLSSSSSMPLIFYIFSIHSYVIMHKCFLFYILCVYVLMIKLSFKAHFSHFSELQQNLMLLSGIISSVSQSCPTLCKPMDCSTPGFPVHYQLLELAQAHVHQVGDAI